MYEVKILSIFNRIKNCKGKTFFGGGGSPPSSPTADAPESVLPKDSGFF